MKKSIFILVIFFSSVTNSLALDQTMSLTLTSNYVFRGETKSDNNAELQINYDLNKSQDSGWYAGVFASGVSRSASNAKGAEIDLYGGFLLVFGDNNKIIFDLGAIEYFYTDDNFAPTSHEFYAGFMYDMSSIKYYFGENNTSYLDLGTGFVVFGDLNLDLHYGRTFGLANDGNDISVSLGMDLESFTLAGTLSYEDKTINKESKAFIAIATEFDL